nr:hypothetical protein [Haloarcula sp. CBA1122]
MSRAMDASLARYGSAVNVLKSAVPASMMPATSMSGSWILPATRPKSTCASAEHVAAFSCIASGVVTGVCVGNSMTVVTPPATALAV